MGDAGEACSAPTLEQKCLSLGLEDVVGVEEGEEELVGEGNTLTRGLPAAPSPLKCAGIVWGNGVMARG